MGFNGMRKEYYPLVVTVLGDLYLQMYRKHQPHHQHPCARQGCVHQYPDTIPGTYVVFFSFMDTATRVDGVWVTRPLREPELQAFETMSACRAMSLPQSLSYFPEWTLWLIQAKEPSSGI